MLTLIERRNDRLIQKVTTNKGVLVCYQTVPVVGGKPIYDWAVVERFKRLCDARTHQYDKPITEIAFDNVVAHCYQVVRRKHDLSKITDEQAERLDAKIMELAYEHIANIERTMLGRHVNVAA